MLRALAILLGIANLAFYGWASGALDGVTGLRAQPEREPERLLRQVRPETIAVLAAPPNRTAPTPAPICLESGPVADADADRAVATLTAWLPSGSWTDARGASGAASVPAAPHVYRVEHADATTAARLGTLKLGAAGEVGFSACATNPAGR